MLYFFFFKQKTAYEMRISDWSSDVCSSDLYAQAGWLNTANSLGYLLGALLTIYFVARLGNRALFSWGIALTTLALLATGLTHNFQWLTVFRFLAGFGGARSEENTSEHESLLRSSNAALCLKTKKTNTVRTTIPKQ